MDEKISRRDFLSKCFKATTMTVALTACGNLVSLTSRAMSEDIPSEVEVDETLLISSIENLKAKNVIPFSFKSSKALLLYNDGEIRAFKNICTHKQGPTALKDKKLVCKWHGAQFNPITGLALTIPATYQSRLPSIDLRLDESNIYVKG